MNKKILLSTLFAILLLVSTLPAAFAAPDNGTDETTLIIDSIGEPETSDPAWGYDTASSAVIQNVYEPLAQYKVDRTRGPYMAGDLVTEFVPCVATSWTFEDVEDYIVTYPGAVEHAPGYVPSGTEGIDYMTIKEKFYFDIRVGISFHRGYGTLDVDDVIYSFQREMVQDRDGGPQWMVFEYLLNTYYASSPSDDPTFGEKIEYAIQAVDSDTVVFNIASAFPESTIHQINNYCGSIVSKAWAQSTGLDKLGNVGDLTVEDITGGWSNWQVIWDRYHNPSTSILEYNEADATTRPVGTAPYQFSYWNHGSSWSITRFDEYWGGWPSRVMEAPGPDSNPNRLTGSLTTVTWYLYTQWTTRRPRLLAGASDFADVDRLYRDQVLLQPGIRCFYPYQVLSVTGYFYTFDITTTSPYVPTFYTSGTFGTGGIPADLFNDVNVRKGFAYAFDYQSWLTNVFLGEGWQPPDAVCRGLAYNRRNVENVYYPGDEETDPIPEPNNLRYEYNLDKARYYLKLAYGGSDPNGDGVVEPGDEGDLWTGGMKFVIVYNTGNVARQLAAEMITNKINSLGNPLFQLDAPFAAAWGSVMLPQMVNGELPIFLIGWAADYPDPHNFVYPFYHTYGTFSAWQKYSNPTMDNLIETGINTPSGAGRSAIYEQIQELAITDAPSVTLVQALGRHFEREWVRDWYYHPINQYYWYHFYKGPSELGDATNDGIEDVNDKAYIAAHWTGAPGTLFNPSADFNGGTGGVGGKEEGLFVGIHDGLINVADLALLNKNWD